MTNPDTAANRPSTDPSTTAYDALLALLANHDGDDRCGHLADALTDSLLAASHHDAVTIALATVAHCQLTCTVAPWAKNRADKERTEEGAAP